MMPYMLIATVIYKRPFLSLSIFPALQSRIILYSRRFFLNKYT